MRTALHPFHDEEITIPAYIKEFGNAHLISEERARCPICKQRMSVVAASTPTSTGHFAHLKGSDFCPTKSKTAAPYLGLLPRHPDLEAAQRLRQAFRKHWENHFYQLRTLIPGLSIEEFRIVLATANRERIWEYAQLEEFQLPYIFATLMDFPPCNSYKKDGVHVRRKWFRCWFDATVQRYDDLWIHHESPLMFWRAWYDIPHKKRKPGVDDLINAYAMELDSSFLEQEKNINPYLVKEISCIIDKML